MKFVLVLFLFLISPVSVFAVEQINSFTSDITVHKDSTVTVVETIDYDFDVLEKHGIFRFIPTTHPQKSNAWYLERYIDIHIDSVTKDAIAEPYVITNERGKVNVKIGNADVVMTGRHVYRIAYTLQGSLLIHTVGSSSDAYWNVNGDQWQIPIRNEQAVLRTDGILSKAGQYSCYKGRAGENTPCDRTVLDDSVIFKAQNLNPGEQMTIAASLDENTVATVQMERPRLLLLFVLFGFVTLIGLLISLYRYQTHFRTKRPIVAQYEPYPDMLPMYTGVLIDGTLDPKDISAAIVYLAEGGSIKIRKTEKKVLFLFEVDDYEITLLRSTAQYSPQSQGVALNLLFDENASEGTVILLSELQKMYVKQAENRLLITSLKTSVISDLVTLGFYQRMSFFSISLVTKEHFESMGHWLKFAFIVILYVIVKFSESVSIVAICFGAMLLPQILIIPLIQLSKRLTTKGYEAKNHLLGFKLFLSVTDAERFAFHDAPQKSPEQFMEYLPYAIALGVEKEWAKVFERITIPAPSWYDGGSVSSFSAGAFTSSLSSFSGSLASAGGSISASGGGGSSGGGGGGGGGGSW